METKPLQKLSVGSRLSDESFITLFMLGVLILVFGLACAVVPNFYLPQNMLNLVTNNWFVIILGISVTFVMITGNFDMSVGGNIALTGVLSVYFCQAANVSQNPLANGLARATRPSTHPASTRCQPTVPASSNSHRSRPRRSPSRWARRAPCTR